MEVTDPSQKIKIKRCKNGTQKYKSIGSGCYTKKELQESKLTKTIDSKREKKEKKYITKRRLKKPVEINRMKEDILSKKKRYNEEFIDILEKLQHIMVKRGESFRSNAYQKAQETIMIYDDDIYVTEQLKGKPGIGPTIMDKLNEYVNTGTLSILEKEKTNPINILTDIYGVGPKKAQEL